MSIEAKKSEYKKQQSKKDEKAISRRRQITLINLISLLPTLVLLIFFQKRGRCSDIY